MLGAGDKLRLHLRYRAGQQLSYTKYTRAGQKLCCVLNLFMQVKSFGVVSRFDS